MTLSDIGEAVTIAVTLLGGLWLYFELRARALFTPRGEVEEIARRTVANERAIALMEQRMNAAEKRQVEVIQEPLKELGQKVDNLTHIIRDVFQDQGNTIAEHGRDLSSLGRGMEDIKERVKDLEDERRKGVG